MFSRAKFPRALLVFVDVISPAKTPGSALLAPGLVARLNALPYALRVPRVPNPFL